MDIKNGVVVRGIGGRRNLYQPIVSRLTRSCLPMDVARAFRDQLGLLEIYLADLDAIAGAEPAWQIYEEIQSLGCRLWVDAGVRDLAQARSMAQAGIVDVVVGLETLAGPEEGKTICQNLGSGLVIFSLDLKQGQPVGDVKHWNKADAYSIATQAIHFGVRRLIVLDLARVGLGKGLGTEDLCRQLAQDHPGVHIIAGGGIRDQADLSRMAECGISAVLISSALHDGNIQPNDWRE
jgi:phosphoribosylformimino-5-aminoimidazole carboxamide ribotide isomerase